MTWALCFNCGATKFGAICPCPECSVSSTGDMNLDIAFSDHRLSEETLKGLGEVVRAIRGACPDDKLRFWSFIYYISTRHPEILRVEMPPEQERRCADILARGSPPEVVVEESARGRLLRELQAGGGDEKQPSGG